MAQGTGLAVTVLGLADEKMTSSSSSEPTGSGTFFRGSLSFLTRKMKHEPVPVCVYMYLQSQRGDPGTQTSIPSEAFRYEPATPGCR